MIIEENKLFFIHIPKTAGTSIERSINGDLPLWGRHFTFNKFLERNHSPQKYFIFTVVRNPWDRIYSCFMWSKMLKKQGSFWCESFDDYLLYVESYHSGGLEMNYLLEDFNWWTGGLDNLDLVIRYEELDQGVKKLSSILGFDISMPHLNRNPDKDPSVLYREYYSREGAEIISRKYSEEIKLFGYSF
jgi:hypothetical protein